MWQISIDTGGTFTDCYGSDPSGSVFRFKVLSASVLRGEVLKTSQTRKILFKHKWPPTSDIFKDYSFRLLGNSVQNTVTRCDLYSGELELSDIVACRVGDIFEITANEEAPILAARIVTQTGLSDNFPPIKLHIGTTKGTNAILEKKGARTGVFLTKGFKDLMVIDNQQRPDLFQLDIPDRTLYYDAVLEVSERIDAQGNVIADLEIDKTAIQTFVNKHALESLAISLINAYKNPIHEKVLEDHLELIGIPSISISHHLSPTINYLKRTKTTVINAYLQPIINSYINNISTSIQGAQTYIMKSSGGLVNSNAFVPKDSLLSGPAGGVVGAATVASMLNEEKLIAFDMGGTSTDVSRFDGSFDYVDVLSIGGTELKTPSMNIHTVAAGGGSIVSLVNGSIQVGPDSAGADPGPACYGAGGPLTITDVNLLLGRIDPNAFKIPVDIEAAQKALNEFKSTVKTTSDSDHQLLKGIEQIANEKMAQAIRQISISKGFDPSDYMLCGFGGAGGLHVCAIAELLDIRKIVIPYDAGILSAFGIHHAALERIAQQQVLQLLKNAEAALPKIIVDLKNQVISEFKDEGVLATEEDVKHHFVHLRLKGQSDTIELDIKKENRLELRFEAAYRRRFGYYPDGPQIEIERVVVIGQKKKAFNFSNNNPQGGLAQLDSNSSIPIINHATIKTGDTFKGPAILSHPNSTAFIEDGWEATTDHFQNVILTRVEKEVMKMGTNVEAIHQALFTNRFMAIADEMGNQLQRTSFSVNIRERLDFSCAILDPKGKLLVNAPHIPVHLGSLGICGRLMTDMIKLQPGDVLLTNHPKYGGSHLPDLTMISGAYARNGSLIGYLINRAHHAEIGGSKPGSMPPNAGSLAEEGVVFLPTYLVKNGVFQEEKILEALTGGTYPSRLPMHNMADLKAGIASLESGRIALVKLTDKYGLSTVNKYMSGLMLLSEKAIHQNDIINGIIAYGTRYYALEKLDDGHEIRIAIYGENGKVIFDFEGSSGVHPDNLNANISIIYSAVLYVLRLLINKDLPLNEGFLTDVEIKIPNQTFLHPEFSDDPEKCPAVVGGNTEVSQRVVDTIIKAFGLASCSQGTMNNFLFGNTDFGYYETIAGGVGAGPGFHGRSGSHQHMTNTRITDVEELEHNYPVRLDRFELRNQSGGHGQFRGGNGVSRQITFLKDVDMTIIMQHRKEAPYGLHGGGPGQIGQQKIIRKEGLEEPINGIGAFKMIAGDKVEINTPGGGGYGKPNYL